VIGVGAAADVVFLPQTFPNLNPAQQRGRPALERPQPPGGGAIRIATLTDGTSTWIVIDYDHVKNQQRHHPHVRDVVQDRHDAR
jgi:hypothetical protein